MHSSFHFHQRFKFAFFFSYFFSLNYFFLRIKLSRKTKIAQNNSISKTRTTVSLLFEEYLIKQKIKIKNKQILLPFYDATNTMKAIGDSIEIILIYKLQRQQ